MKNIQFTINVLITLLGISTLLLISIPLLFMYGESFHKRKNNILVKFGKWIINRLKKIKI